MGIFLGTMLNIVLDLSLRSLYSLFQILIHISLGPWVRCQHGAF